MRWREQASVWPATDIDLIYASLCRCFWSNSTSILSYQRGVFRVNCVDCLDRTSVVQSALSRVVFNRHLVNLGIVGSNDDLDRVIMDLWGNNGDAISRE